VSEFNPADIGVSRPSLSDPRVEESGDAIPVDEQTKREREGLPQSYRMRADKHYVDLLTSHPPRVERGGATAEPARWQRRATDVAAAEDLRDPLDPRGERLLSELSEDLATIASAAALLATDPGAMARRVNVDLIRAQAWRASWLLRARALLSGGVRARIQPHQLGGLLGQVRDGFAPECRLTGASIVVNVPAWDATVAVDAEAVVTGVSGAVVWTLGVIGQTEGTAITVSAAVEDGQLSVIEVTQDSAFGHDPMSRNAPGGAPSADEWAARLGASAAKAAARLHEADAAFLAGDGRGSTVRFTFRGPMR